MFTNNIFLHNFFQQADVQLDDVQDDVQARKQAVRRQTAHELAGIERRFLSRLPPGAGPARKEEGGRPDGGRDEARQEAGLCPAEVHDGPADGNGVHNVPRDLLGFPRRCQVCVFLFFCVY